ncbi:hypothetical protein A2U01_0102152, partial [Trifolium medium]|nr:hypothetical protein [Trifolium medium]
PRPRQTTTRPPVRKEEEILLKVNHMAVEEEGSQMKVEAVVVRLVGLTRIALSVDCRDTVSSSARRRN